MIYDNAEYDDRTPMNVIRVLSDAYKSRSRLKIVYGNVVEPDKEPIQICRGRIGRSTGEVKIPLLILTSRSLGGEALRTTGIIEIREIVKSKVGKLLYSRKFELQGIAY